MSTAVKEKKPFLPQRKAATAVAGGPGNSVAVGAQRSPFAGTPLAIGGEPRVHLLPLDVSERKKLKELKRRLGIAVVAAVVVVSAVYGLVTVSLASAQTQLADAQTHTAAIAAQQAQFGAVAKVKSDAAAIQAAQKASTASEVLWEKYVSAIEATLPAGAQITAFAGTVDSPFGGPPAVATPLGAPHAATIQLTVSMNQNPIGGWLDTLPTLHGFVDATPNSVTEKNDGVYTVSVTLHLSKEALSNRFSKTGGTN